MQTTDPFDEHDPSNVGVLDRRDDEDMPTRDDFDALRAQLAAAQAALTRESARPDDGADIPSLIRPMRTAPVIDLTRPEDCPDLPDGEWSKRHLIQFLSRQPYSTVFIPVEGWEPKGVDAFHTVGFQGHWFQVRKGRPESVPIQIATIIEQSQMEYPTAQSQLRKRELTDIRDLPPDSRGVPGVEVHL